VDRAATFGPPPTVSHDLTPAALAAALHGRPLRCYPAVVSTGSAAHGWAASGAPAGAVVVAERQISPRGHAGKPLEYPEGGLGFSAILRPPLSAAREGWLYTVALTALLDVLGADVTLAWPDEVRRCGATAATVAVQTRVEGEEIAWAVLDALLPDVGCARAEVLAAVLEALEQTLAAPAPDVRGRYEPACRTIGLRVRVQLRAGTGPSLEGEAVGTLDDGALVLRTGTGAAVPVRPQDVRRLDEIQASRRV
jgi:BirA family biotin operon repressor/biotin-[acetyl-CoA-carboxylase] ligase